MKPIVAVICVSVLGSSHPSTVSAVEDGWPRVSPDKPDLIRFVKKRVLVEGEAGNAKFSAAIVKGEQVVYMKGMNAWDKQQIGKHVVVAGLLARRNAGAGSTGGLQGGGLEGNYYILLECKVEKVLERDGK